MRITKRIGNKNVIMVPWIIETPNNIETMPRYIGCRLMLKGPEVRNTFGSLNGLTVVFTLLNNLSVHRFKIIPATINRNPKYVKGGYRIFFIGYRKCITIDRAINIMK